MDYRSMFSTEAQTYYRNILLRAYRGAQAGRVSIPCYVRAQAAAIKRVERAYPATCYRPAYAV